MYLLLCCSFSILFGMQKEEILPKSETPLYMAVRRGDVSEVSRLLHSDSATLDVDTPIHDGSTPLALAANHWAPNDGPH